MGGRDATMVLLDENGIRCDGRKVCLLYTSDAADE